MKSYQQVPFRRAKKAERKVSKGKGKETRPGFYENPLRPRAREDTGATAARSELFVGPADMARGECHAAASSLGHVAPTKTLRDSVAPSAMAPASRRRTVSRYREAGAAADELIEILGGRPERDRRTWAYYCYHHDIEILMDQAHRTASRYRQGEIKNPVTAFQRWLKRNFKEI